MPDTPGPATRPSQPRGRRPGGFTADVLKLASGTAAAQILTVGAAPILTRLFSPADFGTATIFGAISGILVSIACLSYEMAILLPQDDDDAAGLFGLACLACVATSAISAAVCVGFQRSIERALHWHGVPGWPWLMALSTLLGGVAAALGLWHSRKRRFGRISWARVAGSATGTVYQLGAGTLGEATPAGLVHGTVAASAATFIMQGAQLGRSDARQILNGQRATSMAAIALRYRKFPLLTTWSTLLNSISWQLPALLLSYFFNSAIVGFYALGFRMLQLPMGLVANSIAQVFFQRAARAKHEGTLAEVVRGVYDTLLDFGLLPMAVLGIAGPEIFTSLLGPHWHEAGVYAQILAPWTLVWFVSSPLRDLFSVLEMQGLGLWMDANIFVSRLASLAVGGWLGSPRTAVALFAGTGVLVYGYMVIVAMARAGVHHGPVLRWTARKLLGVVPACAALLLLEYLDVGQWAIVGAAAVLILARSAVLFSRYRGGRVQMPRPAGQ
jgi:lipopolysaccharide exporter